MLNEAISGENESSGVQNREFGGESEVVDQEGTVSVMTSNRLCVLEILAKSLPEKVQNFWRIVGIFSRFLVFFLDPGAPGHLQK